MRGASCCATRACEGAGRVNGGLVQTAEVRVSWGIAKLDESGPDNWRSMIHLPTLDVNDLHNCVLGQIYGHYGTGIVALDLSTYAASLLGFVTWNDNAEHWSDDDFEEVCDEDISALTAEWKRQLA